MYMALVGQEGVAACKQTPEVDADHVAARYQQRTERQHSGVDVELAVRQVADAYAHNAE